MISELEHRAVALLDAAKDGSGRAAIEGVGFVHPSSYVKGATYYGISGAYGIGNLCRLANGELVDYGVALRGRGGAK